MAREIDEYAARGAEVVGPSIDPPEVNAAMIAKLGLPFPLLSDPGGEGLAKPLDAWNEEGGLAKPAVFAIAPDGEVVYRYVGADYMDRRPDDSEVLEALGSLGLPARSQPPPRPAEGRPSEKGAPITPEFLYPYYRGIHFATKALLGRVTDPAAHAEVERTHHQVTRYMRHVRQAP